MRPILLIALLFIAGSVYSQTSNDDANKFIALFKSEMAKLSVGKIEEHYDEGYFKTLAESDYFEKDSEVGLTTIYQRCFGKNEAASKQEIADFFEQHKKLKKQRIEVAAQMNDFNYSKPFLKVRVYPAELKSQYDNHGIVKPSFEGLIEVIVIDLPSGIGSLAKTYLDTWKKTESEIYSIAKENTLNNLSYKFEQAQVGKSGEEFYILASDSDLFLTSSILDLKKTVPPVGKYGTLFSVPNNSAIVAMPLNDKEKINQYSLSFMGLVDYMYESKETKPVSNNLFWLTGRDVMLIDKDLKNQKLIYPVELQKIIEK